jgi:small GTP-binding protein
MVSKKICLLGEFGVGKTSLVRRFVHDMFDDEYITTIGVKVSEKVLPPVKKNGKLFQFRFMIWDIAGSEEGRIRNENYWTGASGALIVTDLTRTGTSEYSRQIMDQFNAMNKEAHVVIVGNKADLFDESELAEHEKSLGKTLGVETPIVLTSAKTGLSVQESFIKLAELMLD